MANRTSLWKLAERAPPWQVLLNSTAAPSPTPTCHRKSIADSNPNCDDKPVGNSDSNGNRKFIADSNPNAN